MKPLHYRLYFEPDLQQFVFTGTDEIDLILDTPSNQILLHAKEITIHQAILFQNINMFACTFHLDPKKEELTINFPEKIQGFCTVRIMFSGKINDQLMGWYRSHYDDNGQTKYIAVTQFEERDARRAFPCVDHPAAKATFEIAFMIDQKLKAISNTAIQSETQFPDGRKLVIFEQTPKMCTYIVFFGIGDFEFLEDTAKKPTIRVIGPPGRIQYGQFGLEMGRKSIDFCEQFMGIPYPLSKCDHIAVADFAFGAMENWGAVTYRENLLLVYPGKTSKLQLVRLGSVIAHETSHMWFGNLISPQDWKYLWLNESFASWFTYAVPDRYFPEWKMWDQFITSELLSGLERDSLKNTIPIELPSSSESEILIDSSTAPIIYNKGASVLRMLISFLGEEGFKAGTKHYMLKYQYNVATSDQFWEALEEATHKPVKKFAQSWIKQAGYPYIYARQIDQQLILTQNRFFTQNSQDNTLWIIPVQITCYIAQQSPVMLTLDLTQREQTVKLPENTVAIKINPEFVGFYRVLYDNVLMTALMTILTSSNDYGGKLSEIDRFSIENDLFAFMRFGTLSITDYLNYLSKAFTEESGLLAASDILNNLRLLYFLNQPLQAKIKAQGFKYCQFLMTKIGVIPQESDSPLMAGLRNNLLWTAHLFGVDAATKTGEDLYRTYIQNQPIPPDIMTSIVRIGIAQDVTQIETIKTRILDAKVSEPERQSLLMASGSVNDKTALQSLCEFNLEKVARGNRFIILNSVAANPLSRTFFWDWFSKNYQKIFDAVTLNLFDRVLIVAVTLTGLNRQQEVSTLLTELAQKLPSLKGSIGIAQETLEIYQKICHGQ